MHRLPGPFRLHRSVQVWAGLAVAAQLLDQVALDTVSLGWVPLGAATVPALGLALASTRTGLVEDRTFRVRLALTIATITSLVSIAILLDPAIADLRIPVGLVLAAAAEEAVFRIAAPVAVAAALVRVGVRPRWALGLGFLVATAWFVLQPGHLEQVPGNVPGAVAVVVSLTAMSVACSWLIWRGRMFWPVVGLHALANQLTFSVITGTATPTIRASFLAAGFGAAAIAVAVSDPRLRGAFSFAGSGRSPHVPR